MALQVPAGAVLYARRLGISGPQGGLQTFGSAEDFSVKMEVYTGWVVPNFFAGSNVAHQQARTFLPINNSRRITIYQRGSLVEWTATVSPATVQPEEDEATIFAVDGAPSVALEPQAFPGIGGDQFCLVLRVDLVGLNIALHRITYQVTVLTKVGTVEDFHVPDRNDGPDAQEGDM
jgi:hypothetical protein